MLSIDVAINVDFKPLIKAKDKSKFRNLKHAAASIRKDAAASIKVARGASPAGTPPHTHVGKAHRSKKTRYRKGRNAAMKRSLRFDVNSDSAVIGPVSSELDRIGQLHEFGGSYKGGDYPDRPYMFPALQRAAPRFADSWHGSIVG